MIGIEQIRELYEPQTLVIFSALLLGISFGATVESSGFCLRSSVLQLIKKNNQGKTPQAIQFLVAIITALVLTQGAVLYNTIDISQSIYHSSPIRLGSLILGGFIFGVGVILNRGCISRVLVLSGTGNIRSWFSIIIIGISAYATLRGILAYPRLQLEALFPSDLISKSIPLLLNIEPLIITVAVGIIIILSLFFLLRKTNIKSIIPGIIIGSLISAGWLATGVLGYDEFEPIQLTSLSFTMPVGESLQYLMIFTGDKLRFGIALVAGVLLGAFLSSVICGRFKIQGFQNEKAPLRYALGATLMGFGGVTALGCSIGQGLAGISTLSTGSFIAFLSIISGIAIASFFIPDEI